MRAAGKASFTIANNLFAVTNSNEDSSEGDYRLNVGIMIVNRERRILAGDAFYYPGEWMMPQGGIDPAE